MDQNSGLMLLYSLSKQKIKRFKKSAYKSKLLILCLSIFLFMFFRKLVDSVDSFKIQDRASLAQNFCPVISKSLRTNLLCIKFWTQTASRLSHLSEWRGKLSSISFGFYESAPTLCVFVKVFWLIDIHHPYQPPYFSNSLKTRLSRPDIFINKT